jgi:hypothetical protein
VPVFKAAKDCLTLFTSEECSTKLQVKISLCLYWREGEGDRERGVVIMCFFLNLFFYSPYIGVSSVFC